MVGFSMEIGNFFHDEKFALLAIDIIVFYLDGQDHLPDNC